MYFSVLEAEDYSLKKSTVFFDDNTSVLLRRQIESFNIKKKKPLFTCSSFFFSKLSNLPLPLTLFLRPYIGLCECLCASELLEK